MLNRRQLLTAAGLAGVGLAAAACSSGGGGGDADQPAAPKSDAVLKGTLNIITPEFAGTDGKKAFEGDILKKFTEKHPDVKFQVDYTPWDKLNEKLSTQIAGGQASDLIMMGMGWTAPFAQKKVFAPLDESVLGEAKIPELLLENAKWDGKLYAVPLLLESRPFIYRKDLLAMHGVDNPERDTIDDFTELLRELKGKTGGVPLDMLASSLRQVWGQMTFAFGGTQFSEDGMEAHFNKEPAVKALQWMVDIQKEKLSDFNLRVAAGQPGAYQTGKCVIGWQSSGVWPSLAQQSPELVKDENLGMMLCPSTEAGKKVLYQGGTLVGLSSRTKNEDAALAALQYLVSNEALAAASKFTGKVPANSNIAKGTDLGGNKILDYSQQNLEHSVTDGGTAAWMEIRGKMDPILEGAVLGKKGVQESIEELQKMAEDSIGRIK
ncbi:extracellular solute-binding protein [Aestuariimicrobium ganziense]|uniref:extracellular solute-binding protein n=1 Tax=Aestuariimicrobium ganziense TaxID=2773677 RepID=UPI0019407AE6|nr:extracellular solute-binding protein [Aestuariimicrobium ganziense]